MLDWIKLFVRKRCYSFCGGNLPLISPFLVFVGDIRIGFVLQVIGSVGEERAGGNTVGVDGVIGEGRTGAFMGHGLRGFTHSTQGGRAILKIRTGFWWGAHQNTGRFGRR